MTTLFPERRPPDLRKVVRWLRKVGFSVEAGTRHAQPFNADVWIDGDLLVYGPEAHAGNLLHEAGHLAVVPACMRPHIAPGDIETTLSALMDDYLLAHPEAFATEPEDPIARACLQASDQEAIAWSFAAAKAARVDPWLPFAMGFDHPDTGRSVYQSIRCGAHVGINGLRAGGFIKVVSDFPTLRRWRQL